MIFQKHLQLIKVVHDNYSHIKDLEILGKMFNQMIESDYSKKYPNEYSLTQSQITHLEIICKTTQNSHYEYKLFLSEEFKNPQNHIDNVIAETL